MNIINRISRLETENAPIKPEQKKSFGQLVYEKQIACPHPDSSFRLYRCYPMRGGGTPRGLITKGHCDARGFDSYLWDRTNTTDDQFTYLSDLLYEDWTRAEIYAAELIAKGQLGYVPWPENAAEMKRIKDARPKWFEEDSKQSNLSLQSCN